MKMGNSKREAKQRRMWGNEGEVKVSCVKGATICFHAKKKKVQ